MVPFRVIIGTETSHRKEGTLKSYVNRVLETWIPWHGKKTGMICYVFLGCESEKHFSTWPEVRIYIMQIYYIMWFPNSEVDKRAWKWLQAVTNYSICQILQREKSSCEAERNSHGTTSFDELTMSYIKKHMNNNSPLESGDKINTFKITRILEK